MLTYWYGHCQLSLTGHQKSRSLVHAYYMFVSYWMWRKLQTWEIKWIETFYIKNQQKMKKHQNNSDKVHQLSQWLLPSGTFLCYKQLRVSRIIPHRLARASQWHCQVKVRNYHQRNFINQETFRIENSTKLQTCIWTLMFCIQILGIRHISEVKMVSGLLP